MGTSDKPCVDIAWSVAALPKPLDAKLAAGTAAAMKKAADKAIAGSGKAVAGKLGGKDATGYVLKGVLSVQPQDGGKLPGKLSLEGMGSGTGGAKTIKVASNAHVTVRTVAAGDVDDLGVALAEAAVTKFLGSLK